MSDLSQLPSVDALAQQLAPDFPTLARPRLIECIRAQQAAVRRGDLPLSALTDSIRERLHSLLTPSLRKVINATGVVLHTNLGRAPLPAFTPIAGYQNLEYNLRAGHRGKRDEHLAPLLEALLGVPAIVVNNNAAATYLVLRALAQNGEVLVSRGELVEIGDGFRIPDIMQESGAVLREVGATNKTRLEDYRRAATSTTRLLMRVHTSNFHLSGFTGKPTLAELAALARELQLPLYEDLGSGCLVDLTPFGVQEPLAQASLSAGVDVISFSTDKLLGGPQSGIIAGRADLIAQIRRHPMYRAFRVDKLTIQALGANLRALWSGNFHAIPSLRMIATPLVELEARTRALQAQLGFGEVVPGESVLGGGSTPDQSVPTFLLSLPGQGTALEKQLRANDPPIVARIEKAALLLDLRSVDPTDDAAILTALQSYARST